LKEYLTIVKLTLTPMGICPAAAHHTEESTALFQATTDEHWGADCSKLMEPISVYDFDRHFQIGRSTSYRADLFLCFPLLEGNVVEKTCNIQHCIEINDRRYRAAESYIRAAPLPSFELPYFLWGRCDFIGAETHYQHLQPRRDFLRYFKYLCIDNTQQILEGYRSSAEFSFMRMLSRSSVDGLHHLYPEHSMFALTCAVMTFLVNAREVELSWLDDLPPAGATTLHCVTSCAQFSVTARVLVAEVFEQQGRHADAIRFVQTDLQDYHNLNASSKVRAGRVLGRCHAALGQHMLSVSAFDVSIHLAQSRKLLLSEALSVRGRAAAGRNGVGSSKLHWDESTGKQRLAEVMGRMQGPLGMLKKVLDLPQWQPPS
jgi:hypothetical protein